MVISIEQINKEYNGEWVFIINCESDEDGNLLNGEVVSHSKSREEVFMEARKYKNQQSMYSFRYAGKIPEGVSILL
jgi:hypothetical protein